MTATNPADFIKLLSRIPKEKFKNIWFLPIRQDKKNPETPKGTILKGNKAYRISPSNCIRRLKFGKNVGIYALNGGLMFLDIDVEKGKIKASEEFLSHIPKTFTVRSRNGGLQFYFWNDGTWANLVLKEILYTWEGFEEDVPEKYLISLFGGDWKKKSRIRKLENNKIKIIIGGKEWGELRTDWQYVVSAGSYVTPSEDNYNGDGTYRVINDVPIVDFIPFDDYFEKRDSKPEEVKTFTKKEVNEVKLNDYLEKLKASGKTKKLMKGQELKDMIMRIKNKR